MSEQYEQERILLDIIQHYPFLYDKSRKEFKDNNKKNNAWDAIAVAMASTVEDVQRLWRNLREKYSRERRARNEIPSGSEAPESSWPLFSAMSFMEKHLLTRKRTTNVSRPASSMSNVSTPLSSPTYTTHVWSTMDALTGRCDTGDIEEGSEQPKRFRGDLEEEKEVEASTSAGSSTRELQSTARKEVRKSTNKIQIEETLSSLTKYLVSKDKPNRNLSFGQYVGLTLSDMPLQEQNYKIKKIVEVLNEPFNSE